MAASGARDKRILGVLLLFGAFYIFTNPDSAGLQVRLFFDWVLDQAGTLKTFIDAALADDPSTVTTTSTTSTTVATTSTTAGP